MKQHTRRGGAALILTGLLLAGCGGTEQSSSAVGTSGVTPDFGDGEALWVAGYSVAELEAADDDGAQVARALIETYGPEGGFAAYVLAVDRGYNVLQIASAVERGALSAEGEIPGTDPTQDPQGFFDAGTSGLVGLLVPGLRRQTMTPADVFNDLYQVYTLAQAVDRASGESGDRAPGEPADVVAERRNLGYGFILMVRHLSKSGYTLHEIITALADARYGIVAIRECLLLVDPLDQSYLAPTMPEPDPCAALARDEYLASLTSTGETADSLDHGPVGDLGDDASSDDASSGPVESPTDFVTPDEPTAGYWEQTRIEVGSGTPSVDWLYPEGRATEGGAEATFDTPEQPGYENGWGNYTVVAEWQAPPALIEGGGAILQLQGRINTIDGFYRDLAAQNASVSIFLDGSPVPAEGGVATLTCEESSCTLDLDESLAVGTVTVADGAAAGDEMTVRFHIHNCGDACSTTYVYTWRE